MMIPATRFKLPIILILFCTVHSFFPSTLIYHRGSVSYHCRPRIFAVETGYDNKGYELGLSLLERLEQGQVSKDVALPGVPLSQIPFETVQILQSLERNQDLVSPEALESNETITSYPSYLSNYSSYPSSCRWIQVMPQLQDLFREAFHAVVDSYRYYNLSKSPTIAMQLSPYDLFHGHLFWGSFVSDRNHTATRSTNSTDIQAPDNQQVQVKAPMDEEKRSQECHYQLGILFHCCEYPAMDNPHGILANINLGYHQIGSNCHPTLEEWQFRNVLWLVGWEESSSSSSPSLMPLLEPKIWLLNGKAPEISQLQVDSGSFALFGPNSTNTVWEGFLVGSNNTGIVADIYYGMEDHGRSIWCEIC